MNRRGKVQSKKIEFEPKVDAASTQTIPIEKTPQQDVIQEKKENEVVNMMKGMFAPKGFSSPRDFDILKSGFILCVPSFLKGGSLLVFDDNSLGLRKDGKIYEVDAGFLGDGIAVDIRDKVRKVGNFDFVLTAYDIEKEWLTIEVLLPYRYPEEKNFAIIFRL